MFYSHLAEMPGPAGFYNQPIQTLIDSAQEDEEGFTPTRGKKRKGNFLNSPPKPAVKPIILQINPRPSQLVLARSIRATFPNVQIVHCRELRSMDEIFIQPRDELSRSTLADVTNLHVLFPNARMSVKTPISKQKEADSYVITNVSFDYTLDDIKAELTRCDMPPKEVSRITSRATNNQTKLIRVFTSNPTHVAKAVKHGIYLGFQKYRCEESNRKPNVLQCFKCQGYGHISKECPNMVKCLRCSGEHTVKTCEKPKEDPMCANCGEKHASIYKGCKVYQTEVTKVVEKKQQAKTYANVTANAITNSFQIENVVVFIADLLQKLRRVLHTISSSDVIAAVSQCAALHFKTPISGEVIHSEIDKLNRATIHAPSVNHDV